MSKIPTENKRAVPSKVLSLRRGGKNPSLSLEEKPIRVRNLKDAKKLLGRLLVAFQRKEVDNRDAKDLAYLVSVYVQVLKDAELEQRIAKLEEKTNGITSKTY